MKRNVIIVFLLFALLFVSAYAEDFTLHSGTAFGMSQEKVIELESKNGFSLEKIPDFEGFQRLMGKGTIAGNSNSSVWYHFDAEGSLVHMKYLLSDPDTFDAVEEGLKKKYGGTEYTTGTGLEFPFVIYDTDIESFRIPFISHSDGVLFENIRTDYSHRLISMNDGKYVFIDHFVDFDKYWKKSSHSLVYHLLSSEEAERITGISQQLDSDL